MDFSRGQMGPGMVESVKLLHEVAIASRKVKKKAGLLVVGPLDGATDNTGAFSKISSLGANNPCVKLSVKTCHASRAWPACGKGEGCKALTDCSHTMPGGMGTGGDAHTITRITLEPCSMLGRLRYSRRRVKDRWIMMRGSRGTENREQLGQTWEEASYLSVGASNFMERNVKCTCEPMTWWECYRPNCTGTRTEFCMLGRVDLGPAASSAVSTDSSIMGCLQTDICYYGRDLRVI